MCATGWRCVGGQLIGDAQLFGGVGGVGNQGCACGGGVLAKGCRQMLAFLLCEGATGGMLYVVCRGLAVFAWCLCWQCCAASRSLYYMQDGVHQRVCHRCLGW